MQLSVKGRHIDIGDALRQHVEDSLSGILDKYFGDAIEANVTLSREAHLYKATVSVHVGRGILLQANGEADQIYPAFDNAADRLAKRLRRYKRRLRDHGSRADAAHLPLAAQQYILAPEPAEPEPAEPEEAVDAETTGAGDDADDQPVIVAEMETEIPVLTVSEAVMRMDLADQGALMFRNRAHGGLNMVYRRNDGNIGWLDPRGNRGD